jgi:hypothetical protein
MIAVPPLSPVLWRPAPRLRSLLLDVESDLRGTLRNFGLKVGVVGALGKRRECASDHRTVSQRYHCARSHVMMLIRYIIER